MANRTSRVVWEKAHVRNDQIHNEEVTTVQSSQSTEENENNDTSSKATEEEPTVDDETSVNSSECNSVVVMIPSHSHLKREKESCKGRRNSSIRTRRMHHHFIRVQIMGNPTTTPNCKLLLNYNITPSNDVESPKPMDHCRGKFTGGPARGFVPTVK